MFLCIALLATSFIGEDTVLQIEGKEAPKEVKKGVILRFQIPVSNKEDSVTTFQKGLLSLPQQRTLTKVVDGQTAQSPKLYKEVETRASEAGDAELSMIVKSGTVRKELTYKFKIVE